MRPLISILLAVQLLVVTDAFGLAKELPIAAIRRRAEASYTDAVRIRRDLHRIPEPGYKEVKTSAYVEQYLRDLKLEITTGIAGTGIKAVLRGTRPGPVIGLRADMDALPIPETTGFPYASTHPGYSHACGHDFHMTNVLIAARILSEMRDQIPGTVVFFFQPCEEGNSSGAPSGAAAMVTQGALENPDVQAMVGLHVLPGFPTGSVALRAGPIMANADSVRIRITGKSSHGAYPHQGIDAIHAAATAILQFQALISRHRDPNDPAVLSIGMINGGVRSNVIAETVDMEGTVRTFSDETQQAIRDGMENILKGLATAFGIQYHYEFHIGNRFVKNDTELARTLGGLFEKALGRENVYDIDKQTIAEDFSVYSHKIPALFFFLGTGRPHPLHTPDFTVDEEILKTGPTLFAAAAIHLCQTFSGHVQNKK